MREDTVNAVTDDYTIVSTTVPIAAIDERTPSRNNTRFSHPFQDREAQSMQ